MADVAIIASEVANAPQDYTLPGAQEILLKVVGCTINASGAAGTFLPALQMIDPAGHVMWTSVNVSEPVAAGGSALVSWFPGGGVGAGTTNTEISGIESVNSPTGTLLVGSPAGPQTTVDMPATGVTAATYGDSAHVAEVTIDAEGRITAASNVAITGTGGLATLFDQTIGVAAATIDTGALGVAGGYSSLQISILARGSSAVFSGSFILILNNDTGNNYQYLWGDNTSGTWAVFESLTQGGIKVMEGPGASIDAGVFGVAHVTIPAYTQTTAHKTATAIGGFSEATAGHSELVHAVSTWNNASAITRIALTCGIGNLVAGSRMTIYGLP